MKRPTTSKDWTRMNLEELRKTTREFDKPLAGELLQPLSTEAKKRWKRARRGRSESIFILANDSSWVVVRLDKQLLMRSDAYARDHGMTREELIQRSLRSALAFGD